MNILGKSSYVLGVNDLKASEAFYINKLGFKIERKYEGWTFLSRDEVKLMLGHCPDQIPVSEIGDHSYFAYIQVDTIDKFHEELTSKGLSTISTPDTKPWGMREFMVTTIDGHRIMFGEDLDIN